MALICKARQAETPAPPVSDRENQLVLPSGAGVSACRALRLRRISEVALPMRLACNR